MELRGVSLHELRQRLLFERRRIPRSLLGELARDPRAGARQLADALRARRARAIRETRRLGRLFEIERRYQRQGITAIAGLDEVGMGPLAGPVVAAAVILPPRARPVGLTDSKRLSRHARERLDTEIRARAISVGIGIASRAEIDQINIYHAGLLAMQRAVQALGITPELVLVDGRRVPGLEVWQVPVAGGDLRVGSIAAASIVAKVRRDAWMAELDRHHPQYSFASNAGYATREHLRALERYGPTPEHRRSFEPVRRAARESSCLTS